MPSLGNPYSLYNTYRKLPVQRFGNMAQCTIDVHKYRNNELGGSASTIVGRVTHEKMKSLIKTYGQRVGGDRFWVYFPLVKTVERMKMGNRPSPIDQYVEIDISFPLYNVFVGKGSPENIKKALKLAAAFGLAGESVVELQHFCDQNIGIDCSGFASNFFGLNPYQACNTGASVMAPSDKRIMKLDQVREGTAIVFRSGKHVSLVDKIIQVDRLDDGTAYAATCMVAEATNDEMVDGASSGLNYTEYTLLVTNNKHDPSLFKVLRPLKSSSKGIYEVDVHLANWPQASFWN